MWTTARCATVSAIMAEWLLRKIHKQPSARDRRGAWDRPRRRVLVMVPGGAITRGTGRRSNLIG